MSTLKFATRDAILQYILDNQDKIEEELPLTILEKIWPKLSLAKSTVFKKLKQMLVDGFILKEEKEHFTKMQRNKIPIVRYYVNPARLDDVCTILGLPVPAAMPRGD